MNLIDEAERFLEQFPEIQWGCEGGFLSVPPSGPNGYIIGLEDGSEATIWCHMWHAHFADKEECLRVFKGLIARRSRVVAVRRGDTEHSWTLEVEADGDWKDFGSVGAFAFPFWKSKSEVVYENPSRVPP